MLLLPHHGSVHSATARFIEAVRPSYVIRSGRRRSGPMADALNDIVADYSFFNTAEHGAVTVSLHERALAVESFHSPGRGALTTAARKSGRN